jgi:hypothetical protein
MPSPQTALQHRTRPLRGSLPGVSRLYGCVKADLRPCNLWHLRGPTAAVHHRRTVQRAHAPGMARRCRRLTSEACVTVACSCCT